MHVIATWKNETKHPYLFSRSSLVSTKMVTNRDQVCYSKCIRFSRSSASALQESFVETLFCCMQCCCIRFGV